MPFVPLNWRKDIWKCSDPMNLALDLKLLLLRTANIG